MSDGRNVEDAIPTKLSQIENDCNYVSAEDMNFVIQQAITTTLNTEI
jgi:hypothetical protein